jgi:hypothetical protein
MIHSHNTGTKDDIQVHSSNILLGQKCLQYKIGILWNSLPSYVKLFMSVSTFKHKLKSYLLSERYSSNSFFNLST